MNTQLPLGYFPDTQSHISQAIAEVGALELRRGMIWDPMVLPRRGNCLGLVGYVYVRCQSWNQLMD